jgi:branched-chain amino acid transport system ATP-binding protein
MNKILEIENLHYYYGAVHALKGVNIQVTAGEIVALLGSNGAGKTTTLWCVSGLLGGISEGKIIFRGENISNKRPEKISAGGITHVLEGRHVFSKLTVKENLLMGAFGKGGQYHNDRIAYVYGLFPRLKERQTQEGGTLSGGEQQMLAVGRALMSQPDFLLMDEPSLGLAPLIVKEIFAIIKKINEDGTTILLVEQNSKAALQVAHRGYVMVNGEITLAGTAPQLLSDENVRKSYLGEE